MDASINPKTVLVTGGTGLVGSYIIRKLLAKGHKVRATKRKNSNFSWISDIQDKVEWVNADVLDVVAIEEAMEGCQWVIHSAAMITFSPKKYAQMQTVNVEGTANMVNVALAKQVERFLFVSSISSFGRYKIEGSIDENFKWKNHPDNTQYAISKHRSEMEVWRGCEEGLNAVIINPSTIIGFGNWNSGSCRMFKNVYDGLKFYPKGKMGFVDVNDVAEAGIQLIESNITKERFIVSGDNYDFKTILTEVANGFNKKPPSLEVSPILSGLAWRFYKFKSLFSNEEPLITKETARYTATDYLYNNAKIKQALNFKFTPIDSAIKNACKQYLAFAKG